MPNPKPRTATQSAIELSRGDLACFATLMHRRFELASLHQAIIEQLERVERGEIDRLMIFVPPRHGKSSSAANYTRRGLSRCDCATLTKLALNNALLLPCVAYDYDPVCARQAARCHELNYFSAKKVVSCSIK